MSYHKAIVFLMTILATFIGVEFQSKSMSLFETHFWIMSTFFVALFTFVAAWAAVTIQIKAQNTRNDNDGRVLSKVSLLVGVLASILLLFIIHPALGWVALVLWILYSLKTAYELVNIDSFFQFLHNLKIGFLQFLERLKSSFSQFLKKLKNAVCGQSQDPVLPVSVSE